MNIYEYILFDGITKGTIVADRYEIIGREYVFFLRRFGVEKDVYRIPVEWIMPEDIKCLTCAEKLGVYNN